MSKFTQEAIKQTFLELLNEKELDKISVTEIVERCGINRKTFYYYFTDTYDLLQSVFAERLKEYEDGYEIPASPEQFILKLTEYMRTNQKSLAHICTSNKDFLQNYIANMSRSVFVKYVHSQLKGAKCSAEDEKLMSDVLAMTFTGLVMSWVRHGIHTTPELYIEQVCAAMRNSVPFLKSNIDEYHKQKGNTEK